MFKQDDFNFEIVNFPFLDGDAPCSPSYGVHISRLIHFARFQCDFSVSKKRGPFFQIAIIPV